MKKLRMLLLVILAVGFATTSFAIPAVNVDGDSYEDVGGVAYAFYANSGDWLFTQAGNINEASDAQSTLNTLSGFESVILTETSVEFINYDDNSGTWSTIPASNTINFYAVKAGNAFAFYFEDPAASSGSWSTYDIWTSGLQGTGGKDGLQISHFMGFNPGTTSVPEPGMLLLFGSGLLGLGFFGRKKFMK